MSKAVTMSFSDDVYEMLVEHSQKSGLSKSGYVTMALKRQFESEEFLKRMPDMMNQLQDISKKLENK